MRERLTVKVETRHGRWRYAGRWFDETESWRVDGKHPDGGGNGHWAVYDERGRRAKQGGGVFNAPTADELSAWGAELEGVIARTCEFARNLARDVFVRFGRLPDGGLSANHRRGTLEEGVSVYRGWETPDGDYVVDLRGVDAVTPRALRGRPAYEAEGALVGWGEDGEPVIEDVVLRPISSTAAIHVWFGLEELTGFRAPEEPGGEAV